MKFDTLYYISVGGLTPLPFVIHSRRKRPRKRVQSHTDDFLQILPDAKCITSGYDIEADAAS